MVRRVRGHASPGLCIVIIAEWILCRSLFPTFVFAAAHFFHFSRDGVHKKEVSPQSHEH